VFVHIPVLLNEVLTLLAPECGGVFIDGTLGGGGHAQALLDHMPADGRLIGIDRDKDAVYAASKRLSSYGERMSVIHGNFSDMKTLLAPLGITQARGILLDLGLSSYQLDTTERGFSYKRNAPLDMRMDQENPFSAYDVVNGYSYEELRRILHEYGEERFASRIAERITKARESKPIETTEELAALAIAGIPPKFRNEPQHPARRTFQAIRIEVNAEIEVLPESLDQALDLLQKGGRLCIITFHSLEDRIVKQAFRRYADPCTCDKRSPMCTCGKLPMAKILTRRPLVSSEYELQHNSRASSAKLRCIQKL